MTAVLDLRAFDPTLLREGHLPECDRPGAPVRGCDWCLAALADAEVGPTLDAVRDADALTADHDRRGGDVSVAWVVAAGDLVDTVASRRAAHPGTRGRPARAGRPVPSATGVPSVAEVRRRLDGVLDERLEPLRSRLERSTSPGGPVERRCLDTAGRLAAAALQRPEHSDLRRRLPSAVRDELGVAARLLSADTQSVGLGDLVEQRHWNGLPVLRTQPEWSRRPSSPRPPTLDRSAGADGDERRSAPAAGSLEALVVESVVGTVTDALDLVAPQLATLLPPVVVAPSSDSHRLSQRTRSLTWRIARIDWHRTYLDTGRAAGWPQDPTGRGATVPWTVALAIAESERNGLVSATHHGEVGRLGL